MIKITPAAAAQIRRSQEQAGAQDMALRIAVKLEEDGSFAYGMGFDSRKDSDVELHSEGIDVLVAESAKEALIGATLDYVELNPNEFRFIFINPNDPAHKRPKANS
jgi:iron-sulfur cluster assembly protein